MKDEVIELELICPYVKHKVAENSCILYPFASINITDKIFKHFIFIVDGSCGLNNNAQQKCLSNVMQMIKDNNNPKIGSFNLFVNINLY